MGMIPLFFVVSFLNPVFNPYGDTVLFCYWGGRNYTLEALLYGIALAAMLITVLMWFASYNEIMTSDKFLYCFGWITPSISLVLTMILRYVPAYERKTKQIYSARKCIGKNAGEGNAREKIQQGLILLSALSSWALEGGIVTGDSMRSRGYGVGKRSYYAWYRWRTGEKLLLGYMLFLLGTLGLCYFKGGMTVTFIPELSVASNIFTWIGLGAYMLFLLVPILIEIREKVVWYIMKSKI